MKQLLLLLFVSFCLPILAQPVITLNPVGSTICPDSCASLSISAVGDELTYQWFEVVSGTPQPVGSDSTGILFCAANYLVDSIDVYCVVADSGGLTDQSNTVTLYFDSCLAPVANFGFVTFGDSVCFTDSSLRADNVLWNFGNGGQSTEFDPCYDYDDDQIFFVRLYAYNAYGSDLIEKEVITVSIRDIKRLEASVYPNPVRDILQVNAQESINAVELIDLSGRRMISLTANTASIALDLGSIPSGVYLLRVTSEDAVHTQRIVKQ